VRSLEHLEALKTTRRTVRYTLGWKITEDDEKAIARLPEPPGRPPCTRTAACRKAISSRS
jgi:hypothetical protein